MQKALLSLVVLMCAAGPNAGHSAEEAIATVPPGIQAGIHTGNQFLVVTGDGHLVSHDLNWGTRRDYGTFDLKLQSSLDVANDHALLVTANELLDVDLASGKIVRRAPHQVDSGGAGLIDANRAFIQNGEKLQIIDLDRRGTPLEIPLLTEEQLNSGWHRNSQAKLVAHVRRVNLLYVARPFTEKVAVIDLDRGELQAEIDTGEWVTDLHLHGDKLLMRGMMLGYGVVYESISVIDPATGKLSGRRVRLPRDRMRVFGFDSTFPASGICSGTQGDFYVASGSGVLHYDAEFRLIGQSPNALKDGRRLATLHRDQVLVAATEGLTSIGMQTVAVDQR